MTGTGECVPVLIRETSPVSAIMIVGTPDIEVWHMIISGTREATEVRWIKASTLDRGAVVEARR